MNKPKNPNSNNPLLGKGHSHKTNRDYDRSKDRLELLKKIKEEFEQPKDND